MHKLIVSAFAVCFAIGAASVSPAADVHAPRVAMPLMRVPPQIDGVVHEDEWAGAARMERLNHVEAPCALAPQEASFWVGSDGTNLYIAMVSETPPGGKLLARMAPLPNEGDARTWMDDSVELVLDPMPNAPQGQRRLYHANINAKNAVADTAYVVGGNAEGWRGCWNSASQIIGDRWHFELALPLKELGLSGIADGQTMGIRICRNWQQTPLASQTQWSPLGGRYLSPDTMPLVTWLSSAPVVQVTQLADAGKPGAHIKLTIRNPGSTPVEAKVALLFRPKSSQPIEVNKSLSVPPGQTVPVELNGTALNEDIYTLLRVTSPDEKTVYYLRDFQWRVDRPANVWTPDETAARKIQTQFAYYPYADTIDFRADITGFEERAKVQGANVMVRQKGAAKSIAEQAMPPFSNGVTRALWKIPPLGEGEYELVMTLAGVQTAPAIQPFERHVMPWEHNRLGKSDVVVEPFTPIEVSGQTVSTILRRHTMGSLGLWDQVESLNTNLLAGPMRLELTMAGLSTSLKAGELRFIEKTPTRVVTESALSGGALKGATRSEWDYDGLMKWRLTLEACTQAVERLTLVIPLNDKLMPLFHACTDGLRFNYAGSAPAGQGRVWDGSKAARNSIIGTYVPYIWAGAEERGLAVFGENDRGWVTGTNMPCQELVRKGDVLELRLNLIAQPTMIGAPRSMTIGFQATPTKPMPRDWRLWAESYGVKLPAGGKLIRFEGSCWYWGALTACADVYPMDEDFSIWEEFAKAKRTGKFSNEFIGKWVARYPCKTQAERDNLREHIQCGFRIAAAGSSNILVYTNGRGVRFDTREGRTFLDEWHRDAFCPRTGLAFGEPNSATYYDLNPVESYRDYAAWYYKRMLETFVDHIYWDDIFMTACFDPVGTEAYELPDGNIQPASGLFNMRALIRRAAVLAHELGLKNRANQVHMTNTGLSPVLAFAYTQLSWEDRAGDKDFQDRYSRDYIRAESIGRQHGTVPFVLELLSNLPDEATPEGKAKREWLYRTLTATALVHEIRPHEAIPVTDRIFTLLYEYGYGAAETQVFNYWQENLPVTLSRADASHLIVAKPGSVMVLVSDFGEGGEVVLSPDLPRLGIAGKVAAVDMETGATLNASATGAVTLALKKHDFKLIRIEGSK